MAFVAVNMRCYTCWLCLNPRFIVLWFVLLCSLVLCCSLFNRVRHGVVAINLFVLVFAVELLNCSKLGGVPTCNVE